MARRLHALLVAGAAAVFLGAGCGSDEDGNEPSPELAKALSYLPREIGFAISITTDPQRGPVRELDERLTGLPGWDKVKDELEKQIAEDFDFDRELRPQLGNPAVFSASTFDEDDPDEYAALQVNDASAMRRLLERSIRRGEAARVGGYDGALIIRDRKFDPDEDFQFTALHRDVLIEADSKRNLRAAIDRSKRSSNLAQNDQIASDLDGVGRDSLFRMAGNAPLLLERSKEEDPTAARRVPWVNALRVFTVAAFVTNDGVRVEAELKTDDEDLSERDLPLATGAQPARLHASNAPILAGVREPGQLHRFVVGAARASMSKDLGEYVTAVDQLRSVTGIDLYRDFLARIANLSVAFQNDDRGSFLATLDSDTGKEFRERLAESELLIQGLAGAVAEVDPDELAVDSTGSAENEVWTVRRGETPVLRYAVHGDSFLGAIGSSPLPDTKEGDPLSDSDGAFALELSGPRFADLVRNIDRQGKPDLNDASGRALLRTFSGLATFRLGARAETSALTVTAHVVVPARR